MGRSADVKAGRKLTPLRRSKIDPCGCASRRSRRDQNRRAASSVLALGAGEVAVAQPVAVAPEGEDFGVVVEAVDHGGGDRVVGEEFGPSRVLLCAGYELRPAFVGGAEGDVTQVGGFG